MYNHIHYGICKPVKWKKYGITRFYLFLCMEYKRGKYMCLIVEEVGNFNGLMS